MRTNEADAIAECEGFFAVLYAVLLEGLLSCFDVGEEVTTFLLFILEGLDEVSVEESE